MSLLGYPSGMDAVEQSEATPARPTEPRDAGVEGLPDLCPYLATAEGTWRSSTAVREHRCVAVAPPVPLALEKQRRLCLVADHVNCATYGAAVAARPPLVARRGPGPRTVARTTPVILEPGRFDLRLPAFRPDRISGQAVLVGLLGLAFVAILIARPSGDGGVPGLGAGTSATPGHTTTAVASAQPGQSSVASNAPVVTARPVAGATPTPSGQATGAPATAQPGGSGATYKVKSGDTLSAIAARYKTTVKVLVSLNNITDPSKLKIGQVLKLP
jgi:LysM repeat protein